MSLVVMLIAEVCVLGLVTFLVWYTNEYTIWEN